MRKKVLFLTNFNNSNPEEDSFLIKKLEPHFEFIVAHPLECEKYLPSVVGVIIRNIWPTYEYSRDWERIKNFLKDSRVPAYNPLSGKGDIRGKDYLVDLYKQGFSVIPSVDDKDKIDQLPKSEFYWIKPKDSSDGHGHEKLTKAELAERVLKYYIIQPYEEFISEPSFFFLDNRFLYAITMPNRLADRDIEIYEPTKEDLIFAERFVEWGKLPYGIQRIDAIRTKNGELLLTEVEDIAEYLYLLDIPSSEREVIVNSLIDSIKKVF